MFWLTHILNFDHPINWREQGKKKVKYQWVYTRKRYYAMPDNISESFNPKDQISAKL